jgi:hypothetical protein
MWYLRELGPQISQSAPQPVAFSRARGSVEIVWIGDDGSLSYMKNEPNSGLALGTAATVLSGASPSALVRGSLAAAAWAGQKADIVARGSDNRLWHRTLTDSAPSDWDSPPEASELRAGDRLSIVARGPLLRDAVFAGQDGHLHVVTWEGASSRVVDLGAPDGVTLDGPQIVARAVNRLDVVARGSDGRVHFKSMLNDSWSNGWTSFAPAASSPLVGRPQIASSSSGSVELYWDEDDPAGDGTLLKRTVRQGDGWAATSDISHAVSTNPIKNYLREEPSCASVLPGRVDCVLRSINGDPGIVSIFASAPHWTNGWPDTDLAPYPASLTSWGPGDVVIVYGTTGGRVAAVLYR